MRLPLLALILSLALIGCRKASVVASTPAAPPTLVPGLFVNSVGSWWAPHDSGSFRLEVSNPGNGLKYEFKIFKSPGPPAGSNGAGGGSPIEIPPWPPDWFIYVEETGTTKYLWFYGSDRRVWYMTIQGQNYDPETVRVIDQEGKLASGKRRVPADVILRLPPDLQKLFPPVELKNDRPSF